MSATARGWPDPAPRNGASGPPAAREPLSHDQPAATVAAQRGIGQRRANPRALDIELLLLAARFGSGSVQPGEAIIPRGHLTGWSLDDLRRLPARADAVAWLRWALAVSSGYWPSDFELALLSFASEHFPESAESSRSERGRGGP